MKWIPASKPWFNHYLHWQSLQSLIALLITTVLVAYIQYTDQPHIVLITAFLLHFCNIVFFLEHSLLFFPLCLENIDKKLLSHVTWVSNHHTRAQRLCAREARLQNLKRGIIRVKGHRHHKQQQTVGGYVTMMVVTTTVRFSIAELSLDRAFSFCTSTSLSMSFQ